MKEIQEQGIVLEESKTSYELKDIILNLHQMKFTVLQNGIDDDYTQSFFVSLVEVVSLLENLLFLQKVPKLLPDTYQKTTSELIFELLFHCGTCTAYSKWYFEETTDYTIFKKILDIVQSQYKISE